MSAGTSTCSVSSVAGASFQLSPRDWSRQGFNRSVATPLQLQETLMISNPVFVLQFVAHSNVQQLLASIWYEGLPGFRRKNMVLQALEIVRIGILFPFFSIGYILAPHSVIGQTMRKPFIKFICHSASYFTFLCKCVGGCETRVNRLAVMLSQTLFFDDPGIVYSQRGAQPTLVEWIILAYVSGEY
jgi:transient receptor potential cation channel subfamily C protein 4